MDEATKTAIDQLRFWISLLGVGMVVLIVLEAINLTIAITKPGNVLPRLARVEDQVHNIELALAACPGCHASMEGVRAATSSR